MFQCVTSRWKGKGSILYNQWQHLKVMEEKKYRNILGKEIRISINTMNIACHILLKYKNMRMKILEYKNEIGTYR